MVDGILQRSNSASGFNIDEFISNINDQGVARPNRHLFRLYNLPAAFGGDPLVTNLMTTAQNIEFWVEGSVLPGVSAATYPGLRYGYGAAEKRPYMPVFNDIQLSVISDDQQNNSYFWKKWLSIIVNFDLTDGINPQDNTATPYELSYKDDVVLDPQICTFDTAGNLTTAIRLRSAFPAFVGDVRVNWADNNNIMRFPVSLSFIDWYYDFDAMQNGV